MSCNPNTIELKRGATFEVLCLIPADFPDGHFAAYTVESQLRTTKNGLIADLSPTWVDPLTTRQLRLRNNTTADWPMGLAQFDVMFTSGTGDVLYTSKQPVLVTQGVTQP